MFRNSLLKACPFKSYINAGTAPGAVILERFLMRGPSVLPTNAQVLRTATNAALKMTNELPGLDYLADTLKSPVDFFARDGQWRCDTNHMVMRFFAQQAFFLQRFTIRPGRA